MNMTQINAFRAAAGLSLLVTDEAKNAAAKKRQSANHAARAAANRELKAKRNSNKK